MIHADIVFTTHLSLSLCLSLLLSLSLSHALNHSTCIPISIVLYYVDREGKYDCSAGDLALNTDLHRLAPIKKIKKSLGFTGRISNEVVQD